jgi:hypothetical protein
LCPKTTVSTQDQARIDDSIGIFPTESPQTDLIRMGALELDIDFAVRGQFAVGMVTMVIKSNTCLKPEVCSARTT